MEGQTSARRVSCDAPPATANATSPAATNVFMARAYSRARPASTLVSGARGRIRNRKERDGALRANRRRPSALERPSSPVLHPLGAR